MKLCALGAVVVSLGTLGVVPSPAQQPAPRVMPRVFDVASVKPNQTGSESRGVRTSPGGRFTATNASLKLLISRAYGVAEAQIRGGPGWIDAETFDVAAKADTPLELSREEVRPCLQAVLAERFRLAVHRETKQGSVYSLVVAKNGPRFKEASGAGSAGISSSTGSGKASITGTRMPMIRLAEYLSGQTDRPTLDNTGLKGDYDFTVEWATDGKSGPSIFTALEEQLGLKVEATKGPIEMIVVDSAERPSAN